MEDWQEWQIRADQIAAELGGEIDKLEADFLASPEADINFRAFWPRFRDLKERVRTAPAIKLEDKLSLERRLRPIGSRAYKAQEASFARSKERREELLGAIAGLRGQAEKETLPRVLRSMRRDFDGIRQSFDSGAPLAPSDRQAVWEAWREANQLAWQRLQDLWGANEAVVRGLLGEARQFLEKGNAGGARQATSRFFDALKTHECKQEVVALLRSEVEEIRREANALEERRTAERTPAPRMPAVPVADAWRGDLAKNRESAARLRDEVANIERHLKSSDSLLEQAMIRGTLVDKRRKLTELERANRTLEQKLAATEESSVLSAG